MAIAACFTYERQRGKEENLENALCHKFVVGRNVVHIVGQLCGSENMPKSRAVDHILVF